MDEKNKEFISWLLAKIMITPRKEHKELLCKTIIQNPHEIIENLERRMDDLILMAGMVGIVAEKRNLSAKFILPEIEKALTSNNNINAK